jgi:hypothetical protein
LTEEGTKPKMPKRMHFRLASSGKRLKFYFSEDVGGVYPCPSDIIEAVQYKGMYEGYADFDVDSLEWKTG